MSCPWPVLAVASCLILAASSAHPEVTLSGIFTDHMVLQRGMPVPIFGDAAPGEQVTVTIGDQTQTATVDDDGRWKVTFPALEIEAPFTVTVAGANEITLSDVLLGDVWVCSGQSNMGMTVAGVENAAEEIAAADFPQIRLYNLPRHTAQEPLQEVGGAWAPCGPATVRGFSAAAYFFGRDLHQQLGVPIGLINTSWGGTPAEAWTSVAALEADPTFEPLFATWETRLEAYPAALEKYNTETLPAWQAAVEAAKAAGETPPRRPNPPLGPESQHRPGNLFNAMINPIVGLAIKGAIWYQGESNAGRAWEYRTLLPTMIGDWRERWGQGDFPFGVVQLANFLAVADQPAEHAWAELREAQLLTAQTAPECGLAVIIDAGMADNIHPKNKQVVGHRLALWALGAVYGQATEYSGPIYRAMEIEGSALRLHFDHVGGGLTTMPTENAPDPSTLVGFQICGEDRQWVWADARIDGETVVVSAAVVPAPIAVRYGWAANPVCNLYNAEGLPASPFRTDDFPGVTQQ